MHRLTLFKTAFTASAVILTASAASAATSDEVRAIVAEMMADAQTRSSLLQSGGNAGHDGHFFIASADDSFHLELSGQIQTRFMTSFRDDTGGTTDDVTSGFQLRRTKLTFSGHVFDDFEYEVTGAFSRSGGAFGLENAFVRKALGESGWKIKWGQFKEGFLREETVSSKRQLFVDRSNVNELFNQDFSQAVELQYKNDEINFTASFSDGFGSRNTEYNVSPADFSLTGRLEWLAMGEWKQFKDFTSRKGSENALMLAAAVHYEESPNVPGTADEVEWFAYTAEASWESDGWNAFASFVGSNVGNAGGVTDNDIDTYGLVLQGGYFLTENWELAARYDQFFNDDGIGDDFTTITVGVNNYIHGHAAKFSLDVQWFMDDIAGTGGLVRRNTGIGLLGNGTEEDEIVLRAQFQLLF